MLLFIIARKNHNQRKINITALKVRGKKNVQSSCCHIVKNCEKFVDTVNVLFGICRSGATIKDGVAEF